ncbi:ABC transporter G family member 29-like isoform X2 [Henckelia pumila]|uniref:ABC transporter G family member 29-like isoform X2 n=1 Tax=Henckelia pumila TaxID=405737 RepID=UPI003C6E9605
MPRRANLKSLMQTDDNSSNMAYKEVDAANLDANARQEFINRAIKVPEEDNEKFLKKIRHRMNQVGINLPTIEVRFKNLTVEADGFIGDRALPTLPNTVCNSAETALSCFGIKLSKRTKLTILKDASGIIKPSRITLLLGPPSSGKTTLLLALAGRLSPNLKARGEITYNGHGLKEFVPQKTSTYVSQNDVHVAEMTVAEILDFSARCQGVGSRCELLEEIARREKEEGIIPDTKVDLFMKATALEGAESSLLTDYTLKILGLEQCRDTIVGNQMRRGISGGQKKRLTTGEMIVGPFKSLFMDEITTGLDSSTAFQVIKCMQQFAHFTEATILMSLLQPAQEIFNLFDDIILLSEGQIAYHGPRKDVLEFFESCGFKCPERKGIAEFLQEVTSRKDQEQYWADKSKPYSYFPVGKFAKMFNDFHTGVELQDELSGPCDKNKSHKAALVRKKYSVSKSVLLKANFDKEWLLIKRNSFFYIFKTVQIVFVAIVTSTVFLRSKLHTRNEEDAAVYVGALAFCMINNAFNGYVEISLTMERLPVFYKHRDLLLHPPWVFTLPTFLLRIPISMLESVVWTIITYYTIGFAPEASRFFKQLLWVFLIQQMASGLFRLIAGVCRTMIISKTGGSLALLFVFLFGGFILPKDNIPIWWRWGYWMSPLSYGYNAVTVNEMFASRWMSKLASDNATRLGVAVLNNFDIFPEEKWYWIGIAALLGFTVLFNVLFTYALMHLNPFQNQQATVSKDRPLTMGMYQENYKTLKLGLTEMKKDSFPLPSSALNRNDTDFFHKDISMQGMSNQSNVNGKNENENENISLGDTRWNAAQRGMVLSFTPLSMSFDNVNYFVEIPPEMKEKGATGEKLQLLCGLTGAFRPGVLTALMGVSGAGKTTLMDVLAGRKTRGYIEGDIKISGFPQKPETFARISGYCEQNDIHSPQVTVLESLIFSASLRLPKEVSKEEKMIFVAEVMHLVELDNLGEAMVGIQGISGLSTEQRKRLTIAVELVANPSIIFMDEPTTGLDARAAAIIMRTVRNTVDTGRTVVCTIHQPAIEIFEAFDELLLLKKGGKMTYAGPLGQNSQKVIDYFEAIPGVPKIDDKCNPATWMLDVSSVATELRLGIDFGEHYKTTALYSQNKALVKQLSIPNPRAKDLHFPTQYPLSTWNQFQTCLWKQKWSYWRNPDYNLSRYFFTLITALMFGTIFWSVGAKRETDSDIITVTGAMYVSVLFIGINNCGTVQPVIATERPVFYRERAAGMYSALPYAMAQVVTEIPYVFVQTFYYTLLVYTMMSFEWKAVKFFWFFFVTFFSLLYYTYYGMMTVAITPNLQVAAVFATSFYYLFNLFSGFFIPMPRIPKWWIWYYWICPMAWTVYGLIVSQYGDVEDTIGVLGVPIKPMVKTYIENHFGYNLDFMGVVALILVGFTFFFAFMYAYCIKTFNFQKR